jgi:hypothetical protein
MKIFLYTLLTLFIISCASKESGNAALFFPGEKLSQLKNKKMKEISGLVSSINNPKLLWGHNDSGNKAELFLIDENLSVKLTCELAGIENRDWEDIAAGPGPDSSKNYLYVADIGDNEAQYQYKYIYRFEEPTWSQHEESITISEFDRLTFQLPDERKDTETLLLDPATKNLYVITKREDPVYLYELKYPYATEDTITANKIMALPFTKIVGGDFSADGKEILLKNYHQVFYWNSATAKTISEILEDSPEEIPYVVEPQGEAVAWARDGSGFYTLSEQDGRKKSYLYFYRRK